MKTMQLNWKRSLATLALLAVFNGPEAPVGMAQSDKLEPPPAPAPEVAPATPVRQARQAEKPARGSKIEAKLKQIVLPEVTFDSLTLGEVLRFLSDESVKRDPDKTGVNFLINPNFRPVALTGTVDPATGLPLAATPEQFDMATVVVKFNLPLRNVTMKDVLDAIVTVADHPIEYALEDYAVVFSAKPETVAGQPVILARPVVVPEPAQAASPKPNMLPLVTEQRSPRDSKPKFPGKAHRPNAELVDVKPQPFNIDFGSGSPSEQVGPAAVGRAGDFWNAVSVGFNDHHTESDLKFVGGDPSPIEVEMINLGGGWSNTGGLGLKSPMLNTYNYPTGNRGGNSTVILHQVPAGNYSVYLYGFGPNPDYYGDYTLTVGTREYGRKQTYQKKGTVRDTKWVEGLQYVRFSSVQVGEGEEVEVLIQPGREVSDGSGRSFADGYICGLQLVPENRPASVSDAEPADVKPQPFNIDFGSGSPSAQVGPAAVGRAGDFWNGVAVPFNSHHTESGLKFAGGDPSPIGVEMINLGGCWGSDGAMGVKSPMLNTFNYPVNNRGGDSTVILSHVPPGKYNVYLYGHGSYPQYYGDYTLTVGSHNYGRKKTSHEMDAVRNTRWVEGSQYVKFSGVKVALGETVEILIQPGGQVTLPDGRTFADAMICGLQLVPVNGGRVAATGPQAPAGRRVAVPSPPELVSWWPAEGNAEDRMGVHNGTLHGDATFAPGKVGQAFSFNGWSGSVLVPDAPALRFTKALTIEAWVCPAAYGRGYPCEIVSKWFGGADQLSYTTSIDTSGKAYFLVSSNGSASEPEVDHTILYSTHTVPLNQWTHFAATYDGALLKVYLNGVLDVQAPWSHGLFPGTAPLVIGANYLHSVFNGLIDEPAVYNRALSAREIQAICNAGSAGKRRPTR